MRAIELQLPLDHHRFVFVIEPLVEIHVELAKPRSSLRRRAGGEEIDHHVAAAFADREGMGPDFRPGAGTLDSSRDPAATGTVERKFDHDSGAILAGLRPHPRAPAIAR